MKFGSNLELINGAYISGVPQPVNPTDPIRSDDPRLNTSVERLLGSGYLTPGATSTFSYLSAASSLFPDVNRIRVYVNGITHTNGTATALRYTLKAGNYTCPHLHVSTTNSLQTCVVTQRAGVFGSAILEFPVKNTAVPNSGGIHWTTRTSAADTSWKAVCYGNGTFVAVSQSGASNGVQTSNDGVSWTIRSTGNTVQWSGVCFGNNQYVAVGTAVSGVQRVMTSPNGTTWTLRNAANDNSYAAVTYGNGLFVAVATSGTGNRVMTSPDGITWTARTTNDNVWNAICYGNGLFVAVASSGTGNRVMTSPDGITWTTRTSAADNSWQSVCYGNGLFVAVASTGTGNRVMTSPDGITWTIRTSAADNAWGGVEYGSGNFVAVASSGTGNRVMTSPDGITWTIRTSAADNNWQAICYGENTFVAVSLTGTGNRTMTSFSQLTDKMIYSRFNCRGSLTAPNAVAASQNQFFTPGGASSASNSLLVGAPLNSLIDSITFSYAAGNVGGGLVRVVGLK